MGKLVVLSLDGDFEQGFKVGLEIGEESDRPTVFCTGNLPPNSELMSNLDRWQENYRRVIVPHRKIKSQKVIYYDSIRQRFEECHQASAKLRDSLVAWLDSPSFFPLNKRLREELNRDETIRILIRTENWLIQQLPWHLWDVLESYPLAEVAFTSTNYVQVKKSAPIKRKSKVRILAILGHSESIDIASDRWLIENLKDAETVFLVEPTRKQITDELWAQPWDIIFFAGHSETAGETGRFYINPMDSLKIDELSYGLRKAVENGLQLAIFNSCDGLGLAKQLDELQIPQIIVMREVISDRVAQEFLKSFLDDLSKNRPFYLAARSARERLQGWESKFPCASWLPVIFQNAAEVPPTWEELCGRKTKNKNFSKVVHKILNQIAVKDKLVAGSLVLLVILWFQFVLPAIALFLNNRGLENFLNNRLTVAENYYNLAIKINPHSDSAYYNLGSMYEDRQDFEQAVTAYKMAIRAENPAAYNNLGRLYILQKKYDAAASLLFQALQLNPDNAIKYSILKNLGWARLKQARYEEAESYLLDAIERNSDRASAYCLQAQVLEAKKQAKKSIEYWEDCLRHASKYNPDEAEWIAIAQQKLKFTKGKP